MEQRPASFDWDDGNRAKCQKHGLSIGEIEAFLSGTPRIAPDRKHSQAERRYLAVGRDSHGRAMFVAFTMREQTDRLLIRPISARYMHRKEIENYEKESSKV